MEQKWFLKGYQIECKSFIFQNECLCCCCYCSWISDSSFNSYSTQAYRNISSGSCLVFGHQLGLRNYFLQFSGFQLLKLRKYWVLWFWSIQTAIIGYSASSCINQCNLSLSISTLISLAFCWKNWFQYFFLFFISNSTCYTYLQPICCSVFH